MNLESHGRRILICDVDRTVLELLQIRFDLAGCHTVVARTGTSALETIKTSRPAAMILELNLPSYRMATAQQAQEGKAAPRTGSQAP